MFTSVTLKLTLIFTVIITFFVLMKIWAFEILPDDTFWKIIWTYLVMVISVNMIGKIADMIYTQEDRAEAKAEKEDKKATKKPVKKAIPKTTK